MRAWSAGSLAICLLPVAIWRLEDAVRRGGPAPEVAEPAHRADVVQEVA
jgi:hypothetical protein